MTPPSPPGDDLPPSAPAPRPATAPVAAGEPGAGRRVEVLIVGAGPVGLACGIAASRSGFDHVILEKGVLVDAIFRFPADMTFFTTAPLLEIGGHPLVASRGGKPTRSEALDYYRSVARVEGLDIRTREEVTAVSRRDDDESFEVSTSGRDGESTWRAAHVVLATGYYDTPNRLEVPGEDLPHVSHYYTEAHPFIGERVLVVGGRNSACDAALDLFRHDARVTIAHRGREFGASVKYWVRPDIENRIHAGEIRALFETVVREIRERSVVLERAGETFEEPFDQVFLLTGYHPDPAFLRRCGLRPDPRTLEVGYDPETFESIDVPGLHLAGSVSAGHRTGTVFIENGRFHAERIFEHLARLHGRPPPSTHAPPRPSTARRFDVTE